MSRLIVTTYHPGGVARYMWLDSSNQTPCVIENWCAGDIVYNSVDGAAVVGHPPTEPQLSRHLKVSLNDSSRHKDALAHFERALMHLLADGCVSMCHLRVLSTDAGIRKRFPLALPTYAWHFVCHRAPNLVPDFVKASTFAVVLVKDGPRTALMRADGMPDRLLRDRVERMVALAYCVRRRVVVQCNGYENLRLFTDDVERAHADLQGFADFMIPSGGSNTGTYCVQFDCPLDLVEKLIAHVSRTYKIDCVRVCAINQHYDTTYTPSAPVSLRREGLADCWWMPQCRVRPPYLYDFVATAVIALHAVAQQYELIEVLERIPEVALLSRHALDALLSRLYVSVRRVFEKRDGRAQRVAAKLE